MPLVRTPLTARQLQDQLSGLTLDLEPIKSCVMARLPTGAFIEKPGDVVLIGHEPDRGTEAYAIELFPGIGPNVIDRYERLHRVEVPTAIRSMLQQLNGCKLLELSIFGIPLSMAQEPPLLTRDQRCPFDLGTAIRIWRHGYPLNAPDAVHFASRNVGWDSQVGYFLNANGSVASYAKNAKAGELSRWDTFAQWLQLELNETQRHHEAYTAEVRRRTIELDEAEKRRPLRKKPK